MSTIILIVNSAGVCMCRAYVWICFRSYCFSVIASWCGAFKVACSSVKAYVLTLHWRHTVCCVWVSRDYKSVHGRTTDVVAPCWWRCFSKNSLIINTVFRWVLSSVVHAVCLSLSAVLVNGVIERAAWNKWDLYKSISSSAAGFEQTPSSLCCYRCLCWNTARESRAVVVTRSQPAAAPLWVAPPHSLAPTTTRSPIILITISRCRFQHLHTAPSHPQHTPPQSHT